MRSPLPSRSGVSPTVTGAEAPRCSGPAGSTRTPLVEPASATHQLPFSSQTVHELLGHEGVLAGQPESREHADTDGATHSVLTGDYESWVGRWLPGELAVGQRLLEPRPLFRKLDPERTVAEEHERMQRLAVAEAPGPAGHE